MWSKPSVIASQRSLSVTSSQRQTKDLPAAAEGARRREGGVVDGFGARVSPSPEAPERSRLRAAIRPAASPWESAASRSSVPVTRPAAKIAGGSSTGRKAETCSSQASRPPAWAISPASGTCRPQTAMRSQGILRSTVRRPVTCFRPRAAITSCGGTIAAMRAPDARRASATGPPSGSGDTMTAESADLMPWTFRRRWTALESITPGRSLFSNTRGASCAPVATTMRRARIWSSRSAGP